MIIINISNIDLLSCFLLLVGNGLVGNNNNNNMNQTLPPRTRILAMNMIGDLMRKVGVSVYAIHLDIFLLQFADL